MIPAGQSIRSNNRIGMTTNSANSPTTMIVYAMKIPPTSEYPIRSAMTPHRDSTSATPAGTVIGHRFLNLYP